MTEFNVRPLHDRVIIKRIEEERKTPSGIIIPETVSGEKPQKGTVIATGPGKIENNKLRQLEVKQGDQVLFGKYSGTEIKVNNCEYLVMREEDIIGIINS
jgi:chaperonin GroES